MRTPDLRLVYQREASDGERRLEALRLVSLRVLGGVPANGMPHEEGPRRRVCARADVMSPSGRVFSDVLEGVVTRQGRYVRWSARGRMLVRVLCGGVRPVPPALTHAVLSRLMAPSGGPQPQAAVVGAPPDATPLWMTSRHHDWT